jgi:hypothetical protein
MKETQAVALQKLGEIVELGADKAVVAALTENMKNIDEVIKSLGSAARERLELAAQHEKLYDAVRKAQRRFVAAAGPRPSTRRPSSTASTRPPTSRKPKPSGHTRPPTSSPTSPPAAISWRST